MASDPCWSPVHVSHNWSRSILHPAPLPTSLLCRVVFCTSAPVSSVPVQGSTPLLGARGPHLESLLASVSPVYAMGVLDMPALGCLLGCLGRQQPNIWHTLDAQRAKMPPSCVGPPLLFFQDDYSPSEGFPRLSQEAPLQHTP